MREWALARWPENHHVDLARELPRIKAMIKLQREMAESQCFESEANEAGGEEVQ